ncbi:MAG: hypothetical protein LBB53_05155 [Prevotellaceae bacterium]|jgi:hypothetical protein|nr:hypothetical protein [Prevotellaceae bacterium]
MKKKITKYFMSAAMLLLSAVVAAQTVLPYKNGFEANAENSVWNILSSDTVNSWSIGTAQKRSGSKGLYISYNDGLNAGYKDSLNTLTVAAREFILPVGAAYSIYFDYKNYALGNGDSLYVCWLENPAIDLTPAENGELPAWVNENVKFKTGQNQNLFYSKSFSVCGTGQPAKLVFVWKKHTDAASRIFEHHFDARNCIDSLIKQTIFETAHVQSDTLKRTITNCSDTVTEFKGDSLFLPTHQLTITLAFDTIFKKLGTGINPDTLIFKNKYLYYNTVAVDTISNDTVFSYYPNYMADFSDTLNFDFNDLISGAIICIDNIQINQNTPINYFSGFDTPEEIDGWTLINKEQCTNKWHIGSSVSITNPNALYISNNGGLDNTYTGTAAGYVSAYKEFTLPVNEQFDIEFDWKATGDVNDFMYACWNEDTTFTSFTNNSASMPPATTLRAQQVEGRTDLKLNKSLNWEHAKFTVTGIGRPVKLVFFWSNNSSGTYQSPAAVDNITITRHNSPCAKPVITNVDITGVTATVAWTGSADAYQLIYRNTYTSNSEAIIVENAISPCVITGLSKGHYTFMVRSICENSYNFCGELVNDTSAFATSHANLLLSSGDECIEYWKLTNNPNLLAQYGNYSNPYQNTGVINNGQDVLESRHTLVTAPSFDPRTDGLLRTIPDGNLASVRLGSWNTSLQWAQGLTYSFTVDSVYNIVILQYAVILGALDFHSPAEMPKFTLEILDSQNHPIDPTCGNAQFTTGVNTDDDSWHVFNSAPDTYDPIVWKEWTTVGLNLDNYRGQTLKIRLTTYDCNATIHYGYAYFTLDCGKGHLEGLSCGSESTVAVNAPEGFYYCWYLASDRSQTCISTERSFVPEPNDTNTYTCKVMSKNSPLCYFELSARLSPKWPHVLGDYRWVPENCENYVQMYNNSVIRYGETIGSEPVDNTTWILTEIDGTVIRSTERNPKIRVPDAGGDYNVQLIGGLNNNECTDSIKFRMIVPSIAPTRKIENISTCEDSIEFRGKWFYNDTIFSDTLVNRAGCDSIFTLNLKIGAKYAAELFDTICEGESFVFENQTYSPVENKRIEVIIPTLMGCDSIRVLNLFVHPKLKMSLSPIGRVCSDDGQFMIDCQSGGAEPTKYLLRFNGTEYDSGNDGGNIIIPLPVDIRPDNYSVEIEFFNENIANRFSCRKETVEKQFEIHYPSWIIEQNWNDVIALLNRDYNGPYHSSAGGYEFSRYQWYKNDYPIEGETKSYIYIPAGLEAGAEYKLHITRVGEDYAIFTCPIVREDKNENPTPTLVARRGLLPMYFADSGVVDVWSVSGVLISTQKINSGECRIAAPAENGIYILDIKLDNGTRKNLKIVVN